MSFFDFDDNSSSNQDSSFFRDMEDTKAGEKRQVFSFEDEGHGDNTDKSKVQMKAPKKTKVDTSLGPVNNEFADIADKDRDVNDNAKGMKVEAKPRDEVCLVSDTMRDAIEKMRSKMLAMMPDIKRREEASDSVMGRAMATVLEAVINNYRKQLAELKHEYTSRLYQVSFILNRRGNRGTFMMAFSI